MLVRSMGLNVLVQLIVNCSVWLIISMLGFLLLRGKKARPSIGTPQFKSKSPAVYPLDRRFYEGVWGFRYAAFPPGITLHDLRSFLIQTIQVESDASTWIVVVSLSVSDASKQGECLCPLVIK